MRSQGNGIPTVCANNLLRLVRGELPFERVKGLDPSFIDKPLQSVNAEIETDAAWLIDTYEPRVQFVGVVMGEADAAGGEFCITANVKEKGE